MASFMIYGASGFTGRMASKQAKSLRLDVVLAGRNNTKIEELASALGVTRHVFDVGDTQLVDLSLKNIKVLLNCAGPFQYTAEPLIDACIRNGVHYLDIAAELDSYRIAEKRDEEARRANVMLLPGLDVIV